MDRRSRLGWLLALAATLSVLGDHAALAKQATKNKKCAHHACAFISGGGGGGKVWKQPFNLKQ